MYNPALSSQGTNKSSSTSKDSRFISLYNVQPSGDRLKPPPVAVDFNRKTIKLGGAKPSNSTATEHSSGSAVNNSEKRTSGVIKTGVVKLSSSSSSSFNHINIKAGISKPKTAVTTITSHSATDKAKCVSDASKGNSTSVPNTKVALKRPNTSAMASDGTESKPHSIAVPPRSQLSNKEVTSRQLTQISRTLSDSSKQTPVLVAEDAGKTSKTKEGSSEEVKTVLKNSDQSMLDKMF